MAQLVKLEPGDTLVLSNLGDLPLEDLTEQIEWIRGRLQLASILIFAGDVDLSRLPGTRASDAP